MQSCNLRPARIRLRALIILSASMVLLAIATFGVHRYRRSAMAHQALSEGLAALERKDNVQACRRLRMYLSKFPDDADVLKLYAESNLEIRPVEADRIGAAIGAYRRFLRLRPHDSVVWKELVRVYSGIGQHHEAAYIAKQRLEVDPNDNEARLRLGKSLFAQREYENAQRELTAVVESGSVQSDDVRRKIQALGLLGSIAIQKEGDTAASQASGFFDRAVQDFPDSAEALAQRARYRRVVRKDAAGAKSDLRSSATLAGDDPIVRLMLTEEWLDWRDHDEARILLPSKSDVDHASLSQRDVNLESWSHARYTAAVRIEMESKNFAAASTMAQEALGALEGARRTALIPLAVEAHLGAGEAGVARRLAGEYQTEIAQRPEVQAIEREQSALLLSAVDLAEKAPSLVPDRLDEAFSGRPFPPFAWKLLYQSHFAMGNLRQAERALTEYVRLVGRDAEALLQLAEMHRHRSWLKTREFAARADAVSPSIEAKVLVLESLVRSLTYAKSTEESFASAERRLAELRAGHPRRGDLAVLEAGIAWRKGDRVGAKQLLETCMQQGGSDPEVALALANLLIESEDRSSAIKVLQRSVEEHSSFDRPYARLCELLGAPVRGNGKAASSESDRQVRKIENSADVEGSALQADVLIQEFQRISGSARVPAGLALSAALQRLEGPERSILALRALIAEFSLDLRPRIALLNALYRGQPVDRGEIQSQIDDLRLKEGPLSGTAWRMQQVRLWMHSDGWRDKRADIEELLNTIVKYDASWSSPVLALGDFQERIGRPDLAETTYRRFLDANIDSAEVVNRLLGMLQRQRRFADADDILRRMPPDSPIARMHRLSSAIGANRLDEAIQELRRRISEDASDAAARVLLARLWFNKTHESDESISLLDQSLALEPDRLDAISEKARILHESGQPEEALAVFDALMLRRNDGETALARAMLLVAMKRDDEARKDFAHSAQYQATKASALLASARLYADRGDIGMAVGGFEALLDLDPDHVEARREVLAALLSSEDADHIAAAQRHAQEAVRRFPDDADFSLASARIDMRSTDPLVRDRAAGNLRRITSIYPRNVDAHLHLIEITRRAGNRGDAENLVMQAIGSNPDHPGLIMVRAGLAMEAGNERIAEELAQSVLAKSDEELRANPQDDGARNRLVAAACLLADQAMIRGDSASSLHHAAAAIRAAPHDCAARTTRARALMASGNSAEAISELRSYVDSDAPRWGKDRAAAWVVISDISRRSGDYLTAEEAVRKAQEIAPNSATVLLARIRILAATGKESELVAWMQELIAQPRFDPRVVAVGAETLLGGVQKDGSHQAATAAAFQAIASAHPDRIEGWLGLASLAQLAGETAEMEKCYRKILQVEPYHSQALNDLAWLIGVDGDRSEEGLALAERGVARYPDDLFLLDTRAVLLLRNHRPLDARRDLERCLERPNSSPSARSACALHLAKVMAELGKPLEAARRIQEVELIEREHNTFTRLQQQELLELKRQLDGEKIKSSDGP